MSFTLLNNKNEQGDYAFNGKALTSFNCNLCFSEDELESIIKQVETFTKNQPRDYVLYFKNKDTGERICVFDNISISEIQEMRKSGMPAQEIEACNYYSLIYQS